VVGADDAPTMATHIKVYDHQKTALGLMPDFTDLATMAQLNDTGVLTFSYAPNGHNVGLLDADVLYLSLIEDGVEGDTRWILDDDSDNTAADRAGAKMIKVTARGVLAITDTAVVYPKGHVPGGAVSGLEPEHEFKNQTPGAIFVELIRLAKNRGALSTLEVGFTATHDSFGQPWPKQYTVTYSAGMKYLELLRAAADNGWFDMRMSGFELQLAVPNGNLSRTTSALFRNGQQVMSGPRKRSRRGIVTNMLGIGAEKNMVEAADTSQAARYGRREGQASDGRMTEGGSLLAMTQNELERYKTAQEGFTLSVATTPPPGSAEKWWIPGVDFREGDWITWDQIRKSSTELEPLRVRSISYGYGSADAVRTCEIELNDLFVERTLKLERQVQGIVQGSVTNAPPPTTDPGPDVTVPTPPASINVSATVYKVPGSHKVSAAVSWDPVTENQDGSPYTDHEHYLVSSSRDNGSTWSPESPVIETYTWVSDLEPGSTLKVRVRTKDRSGNVSDLTEYTVPVLPVDETPPPAPSAPIATSRLGTTLISWDGLAHDGAQMPDDLDRVEVMTEGAEQTIYDDPLYSGPWAAIGGSAWPFGGNNGVVFQFAGVTAELGTADAPLLGSPFHEGALSVTVRYPDAETYEVVLTSGETVETVDLTTIVPIGTPVNVAVTVLAGQVTLRVNGEDLVVTALPADVTFFATDPEAADGLTLQSDLWVSNFTHYPAGSPAWLGTLGLSHGPQSVAFNDQVYNRAYNVWLVAVDKSGNRSENSEVTAFVSQPLVQQDLVGRIIAGANIEPGSINAAEVIIGGTITGELIQAGTIRSDHIDANSITADHIDAGAIDGQIITGAVFRTNDGDWRMQLDDAGLRATDNSPTGIGQMNLSRFGIDAALGDFDTLYARTLETGTGGKETVDLAQYGTAPESYYSYGLEHRSYRSYTGTARPGFRFETYATPDPASNAPRSSLYLFTQGSTVAAETVGAIEVKGSNATTTDLGPAIQLGAPRLNGGSGAKGLVVLDAWDVVATDYSQRAGATGIVYRSLFRGDDWIPLSLEAGWAPYSANPLAGWAAPAYKIVGTRVFLRGFIKWTSTSANPAVGTEGQVIARGLPGPPGGMEVFSVAGQQGYAEVQISGSTYTNSSYRNCLVHRKGLTFMSNGNAFLSLSGIDWQMT